MQRERDCGVLKDIAYSAGETEAGKRRWEDELLYIALCFSCRDFLCLGSTCYAIGNICPPMYVKIPRVRAEHRELMEYLKCHVLELVSPASGAAGL